MITRARNLFSCHVQIEPIAAPVSAANLPQRNQLIAGKAASTIVSYKGGQLQGYFRFIIEAARALPFIIIAVAEMKGTPLTV